MVTERTVIAANRFGLGARAGELDEIGEHHEDWLLSQLRETSEVSRELPGSADILVDLQRIQQARTDARQSPERRQEVQRQFQTFLRENFFAQAAFRYKEAAVTHHPFQERLVHFWTNHFAVSADKQPVTALAGSLENEAIRPHVNGRFLDMLMAVEKHPAMILYLDNQASMGPRSQLARAAARRGRELGLNENLAREILELHTLGVDGGYDQNDVTVFAKVLTGWSVGGGQGPLASGPTGEFFFRGNLHEPGSQTVLDKTYPQDGVEQGEAVLEDLAASPQTAKFLAEKLARHFVADEPPPALVDRLAKTYQDSDGELIPVYEALVGAPEAWVEPHAKYKTPTDFVVSTFRAFAREPDNPRQMIGFLEALGQRPYTPGSPAGWPDTAAHWDGGEALIRRIEWGGAVGRRVGSLIDPVELGESILGPVMSDHTRTAVARAESAAQGMTLLLASPEFQRR